MTTTQRGMPDARSSPDADHPKVQKKRELA